MKNERQDSITAQMTRLGCVEPPAFMLDGLQYETQVGSVAYGVSQDRSDLDVYGFCIPPKHVVFPHLTGEVPGFGRQQQRFDQYQRHHIQDPRPDSGVAVVDLTIYSIVRYMQLCMDNNPNMIESLYTPEDCVLYASEVASHLRQNRDLFLHKGAFHKFKGFAHSQIHKMRNKVPEGKRVALVQEHGFDVKFAYHAVRLMDEAEMILGQGTLELRSNPERLRQIRRGEWTMEQVIDYVSEKERELEVAHAQCTCLPDAPDQERIRQVLLDCLEQAWGNLDGVVSRMSPHS